MVNYGYVTDESGERVKVEMFADEDEETYQRELALWKYLWKSPQAKQWKVEPWRWRTIAQYCRMSIRVEGVGSKAADVTAMLTLADQIGMTPAGLARNGWVIADAESNPRSSRAVKQTQSPGGRNFKVIQGGG